MTTTDIGAAPAAIARQGLISRLRTRIAERVIYSRAYEATRRDLSRMSNRDLEDIGVSRFQIADLAHEHAMATLRRQA